MFLLSRGPEVPTEAWCAAFESADVWCRSAVSHGDESLRQSVHSCIKYSALPVTHTVLYASSHVQNCPRPMATGQRIRHTQQLQDIPRIRPNAYPSTNFTKNISLLVYRHIDIGDLRERNRRGKASRPASDNGNFQMPNGNVNSHSRMRITAKTSWGALDTALHLKIGTRAKVPRGVDKAAAVNCHVNGVRATPTVALSSKVPHNGWNRKSGGYWWCEMVSRIRLLQANIPLSALMYFFAAICCLLGSHFRQPSRIPLQVDIITSRH